MSSILKRSLTRSGKIQPMNEVSLPQVCKRRVFYIPGFDPHPPRRYRELYRTEGARQAGISGYEIEISPREGENYGW